MTAPEPFSMLISSIEDDIKHTPDKSGGTVLYMPATPGHGGMGSDGAYLLKEWREVTDALAAERDRADRLRQQLTDAPHSLGCPRAYERGFPPCACWKAGL